jgi:cytochrome c peroxidase
MIPKYHNGRGMLLLGLLLIGACTDQPMQPRADARFTITPNTSALAAAGKAIFFDENLSINGNQSCASCHAPAWGFAGPDPVINAGGSVYEGSIAGRFGNRRPPTAAYATTSPVLHFEKGLWIGGNFWDGRATGEHLQNPAADQAQGPFLNSAEQGLRDAACVVYGVANASYAATYAAAWGTDIFDIDFPPTIVADCAVEGPPLALAPAVRTQVQVEYDRIALAIAAYEDSPEVNAFTSKFDAWRRGQARLTVDEVRGFALFQGKGKCNACHTSTGKRPLFTEYDYDNLGTPINPQNPAYIATGFVDIGLGGFLNDVAENGKVKVPTLRNVDRRGSPGGVKAYMHNGVFKSLEQVVHFYNTRDVLARCASLTDPGFGVTCWPAPEVLTNLNTAELGDLGLSAEEERLIVAFLKTLSDGYF